MEESGSITSGFDCIIKIGPEGIRLSQDVGRTGSYSCNSIPWRSQLKL